MAPYNKDSESNKAVHTNSKGTEEQPTRGESEPPSGIDKHDQKLLAVEPQNPTTSHNSSQPEDSRWSLWGKQRSVTNQNQRSSLSNNEFPSDNTSTSPPKSVHSITVNTPVSREADLKTQYRCNGSSDDLVDKETTWLGWRKPSLTSLRKAATAANTNEIPKIDIKSFKQNSPKNEVIEEVNKTPEALKSTEIDSRSKDRASSWSFWNSTQNVRESLTNKILNGNKDAVPDAMLFEPSKVTNSSLSKSPKSESLNKVVPEFEKSLPLYSFHSSIVNNFNRLKYTLGFEVKDPMHLYRADQFNHNNIKKILIIGVHGFFPTKVIRPLIGEPTGTSIKFANEAEMAVKRFIQREGLQNVEIQKIALEKEGKILNRVDFFFKILSKWAEELNSADYIYFAAHSQGCPVSVLLLSNLITSGVLNFNNNKKVCILAMAGVNNGPFFGIDQTLFVRAYSTIESDSLMELFEFQRFDSAISVEFLKALKVVISQNQIKLVFIGSINDQLVPLYSSNCIHIRHPNIFRATYIDGGSNTPQFVTRVVSIANHLHNMGFSDHGVIKEISNALAGPLTGGGHSKIYHDAKVYDLALDFSLKTNDLKYQIPLHFKPFNIDVLGSNPYHLPWCMRGLLFEAREKLNDTAVNQEIEKLFAEFESWKPETKQLKDMKYRLNGLRSKL